MNNCRPTMKRFPCWLALTLGLMTLSAVGCGKSAPTGKVKGKVLLNDKPYSDAAVTFMDPQSGKAGSADIRPDGTFELTTPLPTGKYTVFLAPKAVSGSADTTEAPKPISIDQTVPQKYWSDTTSDIRAEIKAGENDVPVILKK